MKRIFNLLLLCLALPTFAQINFEPGYFINSQGIKTECLIKNLAWKNSPAYFEYKLNDSADVQKVTLAQINEFSVSSYKFVKYTVAIDRAAREAGQLTHKKDPDFKQETLLLKVLVDGRLPLYQYEDASISRFFYSTGTTAQQLVYVEYSVDATVKYNFMFRQQLYNLMADKITDQSRFSDLRYSKADLVKLFVEYNGNEAAVKDFTDTQNKTSINLKFTPGVNFSKIEAERSSLSGKSSNTFETKPVVRIGFEIELVLPFNNNKWSLFADPNYYKYSSSNTADNDQGAHLEWSTSYTAVEIPIGVRHYMYLGTKARAFIDAAYAFAITGSKSNVGLNYTSSSNTFDLEPELSNAGNIALGAGFSYGRYSIAARYTFERKILAKHISWTGGYSAVGIILGYRIF